MRAVKIPTLKQEVKITTEDPELAERFNRVLNDTVEAMEESGLRYVFIGGIASSARGRPRSTHDIDIFVMPEDAERALRALASKGFRVEKTDPSWLYKGWKENILVDVIFKSKGEIYLDSEMYQRVTTAEFHGKSLRLVAPEDLLIIKAAAHSEQTPGHWHDAVALLSHATIDWDYLLKRARRAPRRILSLLLYAQSNDIGVPNSVIHDLYSGIFGDYHRATVGGHGVSRPHVTSIREEPLFQRLASQEMPVRRLYAVPHLKEALAEDPRTNELDILIDQSNDTILLRGEVPNSERKEAVEQLCREKFPECVIENQIRVLSFPEPSETEDVR